MPSITGTTLDGKAFDLSRRKGSWVVLNFFNTTCLPCKAEHPELVQFAQQQGSLGVDGAELYTITWGGDNQSDVRTWFDPDNGATGRSSTTRTARSPSPGVAQVPETWIVDPQGIIVQRIPNQITASALSQTVQRWREVESGVPTT